MLTSLPAAEAEAARAAAAAGAASVVVLVVALAALLVHTVVCKESVQFLVDTVALLMDAGYMLEER